MNMKASIFTAAPLAIVFAGLLPAADPQLLNLLMPLSPPQGSRFDSRGCGNGPGGRVSKSQTGMR